jgi:hypothetical protein
LQTTAEILFMKRGFLGFLFILFVHNGFAQTQTQKISKKHSFYIFWGWNRDSYTKSDLHFTGDTYNFTLKNVIADDKQSNFDAGLYFNPSTASIPQYNFRIGYYWNDHYSISIGADHMKYVMRADQVVKINGTIEGTNSNYNGTYNNEDITLAGDFLKFEHTDGLNYINAELRRSDQLYAWRKVRFHVLEGIGAGVLYPRTNCTLLGNNRSDEFNLSGYGFDALVALNVEFCNVFFLQTELKGGFINMPNVKTTSSSADKASQHFFFSQINAVFGFILDFKKKPQTPAQ